MAKFFCQRNGEALLPVDEAGRDVIAKLSWNKVMRAEVITPRNIKLHRLYWGLVDTILKQQSVFKDREALHCAMKMAAGLQIERHTLEGEVYCVPGSIDFASMDETRFREFYFHVSDIVAERLLPNMEGEELRRNVETMIGLRA